MKHSHYSCQVWQERQSHLAVFISFDLLCHSYFIFFKDQKQLGETLTWRIYILNALKLEVLSAWNLTDSLHTVTVCIKLIREYDLARINTKYLFEIKIVCVPGKAIFFKYRNNGIFFQHYNICYFDSKPRSNSSVVNNPYNTHFYRFFKDI